jgi:hypothetical protein
MRAFLAANTADQISRCAVLLAGLSCGILLFFVALPLAMSSPYPTVQDREWVIQGSPLQFASLMPVPVTIDDEDDLELEAMSDPDVPVDDTANEASLIAPSTGAAQPATADRGGNAKAQDPAASKDRAAMDEVDQYLWEVYERTPLKRDSTGDFTWKDQAAAKRMGMSLKAYTIVGMDPDFREQLFDAGRALDAAGIRWSMLSAFRDDYRQGLASGFKAHGGHSQHGGSEATGGYGHGRAIDVTSADGDGDTVWQWLDAHGAKFGLHRPMPSADPAHVQPQGAWHNLALALRAGRIRMVAQLRTQATADDSKALAQASW